MKYYLCLLTLLLANSVQAQTLKALSYDISNNAVAVATNTNPVTFKNPLAWSTNLHRAQTRTNLDLGATWLTNTNTELFKSAIGLGTSNNVTFGSVTAQGGLTAYTAVEIQYQGDDLVIYPFAIQSPSFNFNINFEEGWIQHEDAKISFAAKSLTSDYNSTWRCEGPFTIYGPISIEDPINNEQELFKAQTRTNLGLTDAQIAAHFPTESDGMRKIRYPFGILPSTSPASLAVASNTASLLPFFVDRLTTNFAAILPSYSTVLPVTVQVAVYNASGGLRTATLVGTSSVTIISNTAPSLNRVVEFTNQAKTLDRGWYVLSALYTGTNILTNASIFTVQNLPMFGSPTNILSSVIGSYSPQVLIATNLTSFPASLTNINTSASTGVLVYALPLY